MMLTVRNERRWMEGGKKERGEASVLKKSVGYQMEHLRDRDDARETKLRLVERERFGC